MHCFSNLILVLSILLPSTIGMQSPLGQSGGSNSHKTTDDYLRDYQENLKMSRKLQATYERKALEIGPNGDAKAVPHADPKRLNAFKEMQAYAKKAHEAYAKKLDIEKPNGKSNERQLLKAMAYHRPTKKEIEQSARESPSRSRESSESEGANEQPKLGRKGSNLERLQRYGRWSRENPGATPKLPTMMGRPVGRGRGQGNQRGMGIHRGGVQRARGAGRGGMGRGGRGGRQGGRAINTK